MDIQRVPNDAPVMYVSRLGLTPFVTATEEGTRVCTHGRWHTIRSIGYPLFAWDHDIGFGFEDGGGCRGREVDAVFAQGVIVTVYATGKVPPDADGQ